MRIRFFVVVFVCIFCGLHSELSDEHKKLLSDPAYVQSLVPGAKGAEIEERSWSEGGIDYRSIESCVVLEAPPWIQKIASYVEAHKQEQAAYEYNKAVEGKSIDVFVDHREGRREIAEPSSMSYEQKSSKSLYSKPNTSSQSAVSFSISPYHRRDHPYNVNSALLYGGLCSNVREAFGSLDSEALLDFVKYLYTHSDGQARYGSLAKFLVMNFWLYQLPAYMNLLRSLSCWEGWIDSLHGTLETNKEFDFNTRTINGFEEGQFFARLKHSLGKLTGALNKNARIKAGISQFHKFINKEKDRVNDIRDRRARAHKEAYEAKRAQEQAARYDYEQAQLRSEKLLFEAREEKHAAHAAWKREDEAAHEYKRDWSFCRNEHEKLEAYTNLFSSFEATDHDEKTSTLLENAWKELEEASYQLEEQKSSSTYKRHVARLDAVTETLLSNAKTFEKTYTCNHKVYDHCAKLGLDASHLTSLNGNSLEHCVHSELNEIASNTSSLLSAFADNFHINSISTLLYGALSHAALFNHSHALSPTIHATDWCHSLLDVARSYGRLITSGLDIGLAVVGETGSIFKEGVSLGLSSSAEYVATFLTNAIDNPPAALLEVGTLLAGSGIALGRLCASLILNAHHIPQAASLLIDRFKEMNTRERGVNALAFITELLCTGALLHNVTSAALPFKTVASHLATYAQAELACVASISTNGQIVSTICPLNSISEKTKKFLSCKRTQLLSNNKKKGIKKYKLKNTGATYKKIRPKDDYYAWEIWAPKKI